MSAFSCLSQASLFRVNATTLNTIPDDIKPLVFDASFYADSYQDLKNAFGYDEAMLYNHFINNGIREGRCASPYFDIKWYMTQNDQGLIDACNGDTVFAMNHFLSFVKDKTEMSNTPKKMSQVFDTGFYADKYSELNTIFTTEYDYMNHFVTYGANEMRTGSAEFDIVSYAIYNDDLFAFFNNNPSDYYRHFMMNGRYETDNLQRQMYAVKSDIGDDFYATITSKNSNNALELTYHNESSPYPDKNAVIAKEASSSDSQLWHFTRQADNTYKIENVAFGKILDVAHFSHVDATVGAYNDNNNTADVSTYSQRWIVYEKDDYCYLRALCSNYALDINNSSAVCTKYENKASQQFVINKTTETEQEYYEPIENTTTDEKLNAFAGNEVWVDTAENPTDNTSALPLVKMYKKSNSQYYFYLPETANLEELPIYFNGYSSVKIGEYDITSGYSYKLSSDIAYKLYLNGEYAGRLTFLKSTSPAMYLNTKENLPTTVFATNADGVSLEHKDNFSTKGTIATSELNSDYVETNLKKLKGRGNASWSFSYNNFGKYSYNITLESKTKLFSNLNKGKKFCLLANNGDEAYMRNLFTFILGQSINSDYTPTFEYVDLYDNGEYMGSFMVTDKIEVNSQSLDLSCSLDDLNENANPDAELDTFPRMSTTNNLNDWNTLGYKKWVDINEVTEYEDGTPFDASKGDGTYLLEFEMYNRFPDEISGFISNKGQQVVVKTPEFASKNQVDFISELFNKAEEAVYNPDSTFEELNKLIDVDSFIKIYLVQELSKNIDSCQTSYYLYYDSKIDSRLHAAPLWDYDMAYGQYETPRMIAPNVYGESAKTSDWHSKIKGIFGNEGVLNFQATVINNKEVWHRVKQLWNGSNGFYETAYDLLNGTGEGKIPYYVDRLRGTAKMNESRWGFIGQDLIKAGGLNDTGSNYQETTNFFISWTTERLNWMHNGLSNTTPLLLGDINNDSITNITDATELQKVLVSLTEYSKDDFETVCDVNADGNVDIKDVTYIQLWCAGINL